MPTATRAVTRPATARDRLLAAAAELFYDEGIQSVGIDRVIEHAGVAKASLYATFGSKDELVRAYLAQRDETRRAALTAHLDGYATPREKLLGLYDFHARSIGDPGYRGCAFANAGSERVLEDVTRAASDRFRGWLRNLVRELATAAGATDPELLTRRLVLVYDGAVVGAKHDHDGDTGRVERDLVELLVDQAIPRRRRAR